MLSQFYIYTYSGVIIPFCNLLSEFQFVGVFCMNLSSQEISPTANIQEVHHKTVSLRLTYQANDHTVTNRISLRGVVIRKGQQAFEGQIKEKDAKDINRKNFSQSHIKSKSHDSPVTPNSFPFPASIWELHNHSFPQDEFQYPFRVVSVQDLVSIIMRK